MQRTIKLYLRLAIAVGFLSAVADRLGFWNEDVTIWGNWDSFLEYTQLLNPWVAAGLIPTIGFIATAAEVVFALFLLIGFKTELFATLSGVLLLLFALSMTFSTGIKGVFDFSVLTASAASFALGTMREKYLELDSLLFKYRKPHSSPQDR
ncbi:DoxX protein [Parapedobacter tibetensis]|uniref:DoxX protein n=1 Tax=Parapedobacter tibetensis TaxID=2972951 RepID=UPI00214D3588|nr:DoxX protein [Parapedobacter tibetensis]